MLEPIAPGDLEAFIAVAETGGFRRAALRLGMSQPSVTLRVKRLERLLGVELFSRTTRRVALTEAGARLRARGAHAISELSSIVRDLQDEAQLKVGKVVLGAAPTLAYAVLAEPIGRFMKAHPNVRVQLHDDFTGEILSRLVAGKVDLAVVPFEGGDDDFDDAFLFTDELVVAAPRSMALPANRALRFDEFARLPFVAMPLPSAIRTMLHEIYGAFGFEFRPVFEANNLYTLIGLVRAGIGLSVLPSNLLRTLPELAHIRVEGLVIERRVALVTVRGRALTPAASAFARLLTRSLRRGPAAAVGGGPPIRPASVSRRPPR